MDDESSLPYRLQRSGSFLQKDETPPALPAVDLEQNPNLTFLGKLGPIFAAAFRRTRQLPPTYYCAVVKEKGSMFSEKERVLIIGSQVVLLCSKDTTVLQTLEIADLGDLHVNGKYVVLPHLLAAAPSIKVKPADLPLLVTVCTTLFKRATGINLVVTRKKENNVVIGASKSAINETGRKARSVSRMIRPSPATLETFEVPNPVKRVRFNDEITRIVFFKEEVSDEDALSEASTLDADDLSSDDEGGRKRISSEVLGEIHNNEQIVRNANILLNEQILEQMIANNESFVESEFSQQHSNPDEPSSPFPPTRIHVDAYQSNPSHTSPESSTSSSSSSSSDAATYISEDDFHNYYTTIHTHERKVGVEEKEDPPSAAFQHKLLRQFDKGTPGMWEFELLRDRLEAKNIETFFAQQLCHEEEDEWMQHDSVSSISTDLFEEVSLSGTVEMGRRGSLPPQTPQNLLKTEKSELLSSLGRAVCDGKKLLHSLHPISSPPLHVTTPPTDHIRMNSVSSEFTRVSSRGTPLLRTTPRVSSFSALSSEVSSALPTPIIPPFELSDTNLHLRSLLGSPLDSTLPVAFRDIPHVVGFKLEGAKAGGSPCRSDDNDEAMLSEVTEAVNSTPAAVPLEVLSPLLKPCKDLSGKREDNPVRAQAPIQSLLGGRNGSGGGAFTVPSLLKAHDGRPPVAVLSSLPTTPLVSQRGSGSIEPIL